MNDLSLYQITNTFPIIMECEEISEELKAELDKELTTLLQQKSQNIIGYARNIELTIDAMKSEEKRISEQRKILENKLTNFKSYVKECMENNGFTKIETGLGTLSIGMCPISVDVINEIEVPEEYKIVVSTVKVDKKKIADDFKTTGELINGVEIHTNNTSLRIK